MPQNDRSRTFHCLDALRGIAAVIVLTRHAPAFFGPSLFEGSGLGVDLFFVMSGFVIAHAYDGRIERGMSTLRFLRIRLVRLYPLYILGTAIGAFVALMSILSGVRSAQTGFAWTYETLAESLSPALFMLPAPPLEGLDASLYPLNAVAWSLLFEMIINIAYAALWRYLTTTVLVLVTALGGVALIVAGFHFGGLDVGWNWHSFVGGFARVLYSFPAGVLLYRLWRDGRFGSMSFPFWAAPVLVVLVMSLPLPEGLRVPYDLTMIIVIFPLVTLMAVQNAFPSSAVGVAHVLGVTSYAVYALHRPVLSLVNGVAQVIGFHPADYAPWIGIPFVLVFLAVCWVIDILYDQPVRRLLSPRRT